jgi:hypothetical protein
VIQAESTIHESRKITAGKIKAVSIRSWCRLRCSNFKSAMLGWKNDVGMEESRHRRGAGARGDGTMTEIFAQGDLLIERVPDVSPSGTIEENAEGAALVLLEGEFTGHAHAVRDRVTKFRDERLARDIPAGLYIGHVQVTTAYARVTHEEHAPLTLPRGTYRVRRQRELGPRDARILAD